MGNTISVTTLMSKKYRTHGFSPELVNIIGDAEVGFPMIIWGASGHGKSTFAAIICKHLAAYGKVYYNSIEQGEGKSIQDLCRHTGMISVGNNFTIGDKDSYDEMYDKLKKNRAMFCVIDSAQYCDLTLKQFMKLVNDFPNKSFIIISWEGNGGKPKGEHAKAIRYRCDVKVYVKEGQAFIDSRFGATLPFHIPGVYDKFQAAKRAEYAAKLAAKTPDTPQVSLFDPAK